MMETARAGANRCTGLEGHARYLLPARRSDLFSHQFDSCRILMESDSGRRLPCDRLEAHVPVPNDPGCPGELVGESDSCLVVNTAALQLECPGSQPVWMLSSLACKKSRAGTVNEECAEIGVAPFPDAAQSPPVSARSFWESGRDSWRSACRMQSVERHPRKRTLRGRRR